MMEGRIKDQIAYIHPLIPLKEAKTDVLSKVRTGGRKRDAEKKRVEIEDEVKSKRATVIERSRKRRRRRNSKYEGNGDTRIC